MKRICILLVTIGLAALGANAQSVTGSGTTNTIPKFTGSSTIGDSQIHQIGDNIGINTDFIVGKFSIFESRENGINFPQLAEGHQISVCLGSDQPRRRFVATSQTAGSAPILSLIPFASPRAARALVSPELSIGKCFALKWDMNNDAEARGNQN